ncbi:ABC transporter permease [Halobacillus fulvus]|nr:ABC transporter permease [Halobacillus fulvus]
MSKTWTLMKIMAKMQLSLAGKSTSEKVGYVLLTLVMLPFGALILSLLNNLISTLYDVLSPTGNENIILGLVFVSVTFLFIFLSISTVLSSFYFAEDVESFISLPFQPYQILMGKSTVPFLSLYGTNAMLLLPVLLFYGLHSEAGAAYYGLAFMIWLLTPVIPFVITAIIVMFIMRFANISKNKDRTKIVVGLLGFAFAIGINVIIRLDSGGNAGEDMAALFMQQNGLLELITKFFPVAYFSSIALTTASTGTAALYFLLVAGLSAGAIVLFMTIGQATYFKGVLGLSGGKRSTFNDKTLDENVKETPLLWSLVLKEVRTIMRTPTFFTQIVVQSLFFPIFLVIILFMESSGSLDQISAMLGSWDGKIVLLALFGLTIVGLGINPASFSSVSRDGKSWFNYLYLPIPARTVIGSKLLIAFALNLVSLLILALVAVFLIGIPVWPLVNWLFLSIIAAWVTSVGGLLIDLYQPKLNWTDEREVFKGRFAGLVVFAIEAVIFGGAIGILWNMSSVEGVWITSLILFTLLIVLTAGCHFGLKKLVDQKYDKIL